MYMYTMHRGTGAIVQYDSVPTVFGAGVSDLHICVHDGLRISEG